MSLSETVALRQTLDLHFESNSSADYGNANPRHVRLLILAVVVSALVGSIAATHERTLIAAGSAGEGSSEPVGVSDGWGNLRGYIERPDFEPTFGDAGTRR